MLSFTLFHLKSRKHMAFLLQNHILLFSSEKYNWKVRDLVRYNQVSGGVHSSSSQLFLLFLFHEVFAPRTLFLMHFRKTIFILYYSYFYSCSQILFTFFLFDKNSMIFEKIMRCYTKKLLRSKFITQTEVVLYVLRKLETPLDLFLLQ